VKAQVKVCVQNRYVYQGLNGKL